MLVLSSRDGFTKDQVLVISIDNKTNFWKLKGFYEILLIYANP